MWKPLIFLVVIAVGRSAGRYELQGQKREKLEGALEKACKDYASHSQIDQIKGLALEASVCLYLNFDKAMSSPPQANATDEQMFLDFTTHLCEVRQVLRECAQQVLENLAPCTSAPVQAKLGDMKAAVTELFKYFCDDDMARPRRVVNDGAFACLEKNSQQMDNCTKNMVDLVINMPEDTSSFDAIDMCYKYDTMVSCVLDTLSTCPKPSAKEFAQDITSLFRSGTFCRVTVPDEQCSTNEGGTNKQCCLIEAATATP